MLSRESPQVFPRLKRVGWGGEKSHNLPKSCWAHTRERRKRTGTLRESRYRMAFSLCVCVFLLAKGTHHMHTIWSVRWSVCSLPLSNVWVCVGRNGCATRDSLARIQHTRPVAMATVVLNRIANLPPCVGHDTNWLQTRLLYFQLCHRCLAIFYTFLWLYFLVNHFF
jgi:hypothetical protein